MRTIDARRAPRLLAGLSILMGLALVPAPAAADQLQAQGQRMEVNCRADYDVELNGRISYHLPPGGVLECAVTGLMVDVEASWGAELFDEMDDEMEPFDEQGGPLVAVDGTASFTIEIPAVPGIPLGMSGRVRQGVKWVFFGGSTSWYYEREMTCTPDPVPEGGTVECVAEDMEPDREFDWEVVFFTSVQPNPREYGAGTADADGVVIFSFVVPAGSQEDGYWAWLEQGWLTAGYRGKVGPASSVTSARPEPPAKNPQPTAQVEPQPVTVQQPTRVDTGAGGTAPAGIPPLLLVGALVVGAIVRGVASPSRDPRGG
jgi:hypothetical protein